MTPQFVITGTDTGIGKTVFSAALVQALGAQYWKPVQAGIEDETDTQFVERIVPGSTLPEAWRLVTPASRIWQRGWIMWRSTPMRLPRPPCLARW